MIISTVTTTQTQTRNKMNNNNEIKITLKRDKKNLVDNTRFMRFAGKAVVLQMTSTNCNDSYLIVHDEDDYEDKKEFCSKLLNKKAIGWFQFITIPLENVEII